MKPYLPPQKPHIGRPRADMQKLMNGIFYVVRTGCKWQVVNGKIFPVNIS
ncbi:MAG TPA: transposase [Methanosarcina sp.]|nr:transposase [Methanosarcina sp.]